MSPNEFVRDYERALATQTWEAVRPLIHQNATVTFSNGAVHKGKTTVRIAYENNFEKIKNETYTISNVHWVLETENSATYTFDFQWVGLINGKAASGAGRGTAVLVRMQDKWQLIAEHLGPCPKHS
ncbi:MAG: nuclear transport factor 2 family protein [Pseudomonadota bacterium]